MQPRDRLSFSPITKRPALRFPSGIRLVVWPVLALEEWDISRPMARTVISPPQGQPQLPDMPNWSGHEYGMRVGFWRLRKMLGQVGAKPTVTLNARVCETYLPRGRRGVRRKRLGAQRTQLRSGADAQARRSARRHHEINGHH